MARRKPDPKSANQKRSDQIRRRRSVSSRPSIRKPTSRTMRLEQPTAPPVMARTASGMAHPQAKSFRKSKRRYDVTLNAQQGAEMRLPALPHVRIGWRVASFIIAAILSFGLYQLWNSSVYRVDAAQVDGLSRLTSSTVNAELPITGKVVFMLDASCLKENVERAFPEFSSAEVQVALPNTVVVTVTERLPVLIWKNGATTEFVDADGVAFSAREDMPFPVVPIVNANGEPPAPYVPDEPEETTDQSKFLKRCGINVDQEPIYKPAHPLLKPEMVRAVLFLTDQIPDGVELIYDPLHGLGWHDPMGWDVYLGDVKDIDIKLHVYDAILQRLRTDGTKPVLVSVEYLHAPYYRLQQDGE